MNQRKQARYLTHHTGQSAYWNSKPHLVRRKGWKNRNKYSSATIPVKKSAGIPIISGEVR